MASLLKEWPRAASHRMPPATGAWRSPLLSVALEAAVTLPFVLPLRSTRGSGSRVLVGAAATSLVVHGLGLAWMLNSAPLPAPASPPIPVELVAMVEDGARATAALAAKRTSTPPPARGAVRRSATALFMPRPAAPRTVADKPGPQTDGGGAPSVAALVSAAPARDAEVARRVFGEGEVDLPARPLVRVRPRYPEHARLMARESDVKLAVTWRPTARCRASNSCRAAEKSSIARLVMRWNACASSLRVEGALQWPRLLRSPCASVSTTDGRIETRARAPKAPPRTLRGEDKRTIRRPRMPAMGGFLGDAAAQAEATRSTPRPPRAGSPGRVVPVQRKSVRDLPRAEVCETLRRKGRPVVHHVLSVAPLPLCGCTERTAADPAVYASCQQLAGL
jgi:hypothetical protein